jgi:hypothetical protein
MIKLKFTVNGTLNVQMKNMFNSFESIGIYWQRNPDKGQTFDLQTDIPYTFGSNVGLNVNVNIFRQDSTFANVKFLPAIYYISPKQKLGLKGTFESSAILDSLYTSGRDYSKKGIGVYYQYQEGSDIPLFINKSNIRLEADFLKTTYDDTQEKFDQIRYFIFAEHNFNLSGNHFLNIKGESALLSSKNELSTNELFGLAAGIRCAVSMSKVSSAISTHLPAPNTVILSMIRPFSTSLHNTDKCPTKHWESHPNFTV